MDKNINLIVAICNNNGIGINNTLPWKVSSDLKKFRNLTQGKGNNAIIMGKNTWNSIGSKPLAKRDNLILSTSLEIEETFGELSNGELSNGELTNGELATSNIVKSFKNIDDLKKFYNSKNYDELWIIGGEKVYKLFMDNKLVNNLYITYIDYDFECTTFFPKIDTTIYKFSSQNIHNSNNKYDYDIFDRLYQKI